VAPIPILPLHFVVLPVVLAITPVLFCQVTTVAEHTVRLDVGTTKNNEGREVALTDTLFTLLREQLRGKKTTDFVLTREDGWTVRSFNDRWQHCCVLAKVGAKVHRQCFRKAEKENPQRAYRDINAAVTAAEKFTLDDALCCKTCGDRVRHRDLAYAGLLFHDLRRSAARDLLRAGVQEKIVQTILGHKTRAMLDRYAIVNHKDVQAAMQKYQKQQLADREVLQAENSANLDTRLGVGTSEALSAVEISKGERPN
jgi:integrase